MKLRLSNIESEHNTVNHFLIVNLCVPFPWYFPPNVSPLYLLRIVSLTDMLQLFPVLMSLFLMDRFSTDGWSNSLIKFMNLWCSGSQPTTRRTIARYLLCLELKLLWITARCNLLRREAADVLFNVKA